MATMITNTATMTNINKTECPAPSERCNIIIIMMIMVVVPFFLIIVARHFLSTDVLNSNGGQAVSLDMKHSPVMKDVWTPFVLNNNYK